MFREAGERHEQRQADHHQHADCGGEGYGGGDIIAVGVDHRRDGGDRRVAADRIAARDQDRHLHRQAEQPAQAEARPQRQCHGGEDPDQQRRPGRKDGAEAERGAEQGDGDLEQLLGAEGDAGAEAIPGGPCGADGHPDQDGHHQGFDIGVVEDVFLDDLDADGNGCDGEAEGEPGQAGQHRRGPQGRFGRHRFQAITASLQVIGGISGPF